MKLKQKLAGLMAALMVLGLGSTAVMAYPSSGASDYGSPDSGDYVEDTYVEEKIADGIWFVATGTDSKTPWLSIKGSATKNIDDSLAKGFAYSCERMTTQKTAIALNIADAVNGKTTVAQKYMAKIEAAKGWVTISGTSATTGKYDSFYVSSEVANGSKAFTVDISTESNSKVADKIKKSGYAKEYAEITLKGAGNLPGSTYVSLRATSVSGSDYIPGYVYRYNAIKDCLELVKNTKAGYIVKGRDICLYSVSSYGSYVIAQDMLPDSITSEKTAVADTGNAKTTEEVTSKITNAITKAKEDKATVVKAEIPADVKVSTKSFKEAKEAGLKLVIEPEDKNVTWSFGKLDKIDEMAGDFDPSVKIGDGVVPAIDTAVAKNTSKTLKYTTVSFAYDGKLPGETDVTLDLSAGDFKEGAKIYLYYFNETNKKFELVDDAIYTEGFATFTMTHCSDYIVTNEPLGATVTNSNATTSPAKAAKTGDTATMMVFGLVLLAGFGLMAVAYTRKRRA